MRLLPISSEYLLFFALILDNSLSWNAAGNTRLRECLMYLFLFVFVPYFLFLLQMEGSNTTIVITAFLDWRNGCSYNFMCDSNEATLFHVPG